MATKRKENVLIVGVVGLIGLVACVWFIRTVLLGTETENRTIEWFVVVSWIGLAMMTCPYCIYYTIRRGT